LNKIPHLSILPSARGLSYPQTKTLVTAVSLAARKQLLSFGYSHGGFASSAIVLLLRF